MEDLEAETVVVSTEAETVEVSEEAIVVQSKCTKLHVQNAQSHVKCHFVQQAKSQFTVKIVSVQRRMPAEIADHKEGNLVEIEAETDQILIEDQPVEMMTQRSNWK